ncbi:MAG: zinc-ribbon domain-containing protein [Chloroflexi bacterium]|nr:zinc-ribbon domain-containing protein [Chloroflexota bacterium]
MAQEMPQICPRCGAELIPNQHFCARCGLDITANSAGADPQGASTMAQPASSWTAQSSLLSRIPQQQMVQQPVGPSAMSALPTSKRGRPRLVLVLLVVIVVFSVAGYFGYHLLGGSALIPSTQPPITTAAINSTITYAGIDVTVLNAQQSQSFIDDPSTSSTGMVRLHIQAQNQITVSVNLAYNNIARLLLPGGKVVAPIYVKSNSSVAPGATLTSIVDFAVPTASKLDQLTFRLGAANEAQMNIPLTGHVDLSKYAPKTVNLNGKLQYLGMDWMLVSATSQLSIDGQQASSGMHYVIVTLKVNNTLSQTAISGSPFDYIRLKAGNTVVAPKDATLPVSFDAGVTGKSGTVTFLVPQDSTTLTLILGFQQQNGFNQDTANFQV